jgi:predicted enzyme related to lactoylglutathione lyase
VKEVSVIVYPAADLDKAKAFFRELMGADPYVDSPYYVGFKNGNMEIGLDPHGGNYGPGAIPFWTVEDISAAIKSLSDAGGTVVQDATDVAGGLLVSRIKEPNGAMIGLRQLPKE